MRLRRVDHCWSLSEALLQRSKHRKSFGQVVDVCKRGEPPGRREIPACGNQEHSETACVRSRSADDPRGNFPYIDVGLASFDLLSNAGAV